MLGCVGMTVLLPCWLGKLVGTYNNNYLMVAFYTGIEPYLGSLPPPASLVSIPLLSTSVGVPANTGGAMGPLALLWCTHQEGNGPVLRPLETTTGVPGILRAGGIRTPATPGKEPAHTASIYCGHQGLTMDTYCSYT